MLFDENSGELTFRKTVMFTLPYATLSGQKEWYAFICNWKKI